MLNHLHGQAGDQPAGSMQGWGKTYDLFVGLLSLGQEQKLRQATLDLAGVRPGERVLEVGCGTGTLSLAAKVQAGPNGEVTGIDVASDMLDAARSKAARANVQVRYQLGRIEQIPFADQQFDLVISSLMLHHVPGDNARQQGLKEIYRVLKPGGRVLIVDVARFKNPYLLRLAKLVVGEEMLANSLARFVPMMAKAGFNMIETGPTQSSFLEYLSGKRF